MKLRNLKNSYLETKLNQKYWYLIKTVLFCFSCLLGLYVNKVM